MNSDQSTSSPPQAPQPVFQGTARPKLNERLYRTEAIVIGRLDLGEADRILTLFTPQYGKLRVVAKGVRRPSSRLGPHLELFTRVQLQLARGRELDVVTGAETLDPHIELRTDLDILSHASHMAELITRLTEDREEHEAAYGLLKGSLRLLCDAMDPFAVTRHFEMALLAILGYRPELYRCLECERELAAEPNALSIRRGGMLCPRCRATDPQAVPLSVNAQKYLRLLDRQGLRGVIGLRTSPELQRELEGVLTAYLRHHAERDLQSLHVWHQIREPNASGG